MITVREENKPQEIVLHIYVHLEFPVGTRPLRVAPVADAIEAPHEHGEREDVEAMLSRFEQFEPETRAREVYSQLVEEGWQPFTPQPRGDKNKSDGTYVRMVYLGRRRRVTMYLSSVALVSAGAAERGMMKSLTLADPRTGREVYFFHSMNRHQQQFSVDAAVGAAGALRAWADGKPS